MGHAPIGDELGARLEQEAELPVQQQAGAQLRWLQQKCADAEAIIAHQNDINRVLSDELSAERAHVDGISLRGTQPQGRPPLQAGRDSSADNIENRSQLYGELASASLISADDEARVEHMLELSKHSARGLANVLRAADLNAERAAATERAAVVVKKTLSAEVNALERAHDVDNSAAARVMRLVAALARAFGAQ
ncbi:hypothetical protein T492DRAFT_856366, partial [Pavlovales sp. CCMP2436]